MTITTPQAVRAILRLIDSPLVGDVEGDHGSGYIIQSVYETGTYDTLSSGEQTLLNIAASLWQAPHDVGARVNAIHDLDRDNRRKVLTVLWHLFVGADPPAGAIESAELFGGAVVKVGEV